MESHPTEHELERFLLHQTPEEELEGLETHILGCNACVGRLEDLEVQIAATRVALRELEQERAAKTAAKQRATWKNWLSVPKLSLAGGVAVIAVGVALIPHIIEQAAPNTEANLSTYRGTETLVLPANHRLHVHLNARDLAEGPVTAKLVDGRGNLVWEGASQIRHDDVDVLMPSLREHGDYFVRLYAPEAGIPEKELLREFAFQVK